MPDSFIPYGPDPATSPRKDATAKRTETRDGVSAEYHRSEVLIARRRITTFRGRVSTFRTIGAGATPQNLFTIENATGSPVLVALRLLRIWSHQVTASAVLPPWFSLSRLTTLPTGGTTMSKVSVDPRDAASNANVVLRQATTADGAALTAITATAGVRQATGIAVQLYTAAAGLQPQNTDIVSWEVPDDFELMLGAGQAYLVQVITAAAADNIAGRSFHITCAWEEYTEY